MAKKPESSFSGGINRHLPRSLHFEKMYNPFRGGTADFWYSGPSADLWVEYKFVPRIPVSASIRPALTPKQVHWLGRRYAEGRNVAVILGCPDGGVIYTHRGWESPLTPEEFFAILRPRKALAVWIEDFTCHGSELSSRPQLLLQPCTES